jgi:hypothetical protein
MHAALVPACSITCPAPPPVALVHSQLPYTQSHPPRSHPPLLHTPTLKRHTGIAFNTHRPTHRVQLLLVLLYEVCCVVCQCHLFLSELVQLLLLALEQRHQLLVLLCVWGGGVRESERTRCVVCFWVGGWVGGAWQERQMETEEGRGQTQGLAEEARGLGWVRELVWVYRSKRHPQQAQVIRVKCLAAAVSRSPCSLQLRHGCQQV